MMTQGKVALSCSSDFKERKLLCEKSSPYKDIHREGRADPAVISSSLRDYRGNHSQTYLGRHKKLSRLSMPRNTPVEMLSSAFDYTSHKASSNVILSLIGPRRMREVLKQSASFNTRKNSKTALHSAPHLIPSAAMINKRSILRKNNDNTIEESVKNQRLKESKELHSKFTARLRTFADLSLDFDLSFGSSHLIIEMLQKKCRSIPGFKFLNERCEGDYNIVCEQLLAKLNCTHDSRTFKKSLHAEMQESTRILRCVLKDLLEKDENCCSALVIDALWKLVIANMELVVECESKAAEKAAKETRRNLEVAEEERSSVISQLDTYKKLIQLDYEMKKERCNTKLQSAIRDKKELQKVIEGMSLQINDLTDISRFIHIHYFLAEFDYKFEASKELHVERLNCVKNMLLLILSRENDDRELNDELSTTETYFPKYIIQILRKLQSQLSITTKNVQYKFNRIQESLKNINVAGYNKLIDEAVQTKEVIQQEVQKKRSWQSIVMEANLKNAIVMAPEIYFKDLEELIEKKLLEDSKGNLVHANIGYNAEYIDFGNYMFKHYIEKCKLRSEAIDALLPMFAVKYLAC
eukprot:TRINITY_DN11170_c0_g2_i6.p1 TRINITY_DN11170_c0_g2~~TRINITY_DN11170_c0_g2_i6.p1  ORF type:complete len:581 (-),score=104.22 TRINITY_DN11170_c0_g2_i6:122-1864(-)